LLACARDLHASRDVASLRLWLLESGLPRLIPSDWYSYNEVDLGAPHKTFTMLRPAPDAFASLLPRFAQLSHQHPIIACQLNQRELPVRKISDFLPRAAYHKLELYQEVYRPLGVEYQMSAALETRQGFITALALSRKRRDYSERDRAVLEQLRAQLYATLGSLLAAEHTRIVSSDYGRTLEHHAIGTLTVGPRGEIVHSHGRALDWLGLAGKTRLPERLLTWARAQRAAPRTLSEARAPLRLARASGEVEIEVRALPATQPNHLLLTVTRQRARHGAGANGTLGLSAREAEVARWIAEGKTNLQIALILGISPRTVQKHIEHIFERLGVESRVAIAVRVLETGMQ